MKNKKTFIFGIILVVALVGVVFFMRSFRGNKINHAASTEKATIKLKGPENAQVRIEEYSDFQCPACMKAQPALSAIAAKYPDKVVIVFHHFPLKGHQWAAMAHQAAECSAVQGKFWEYHDLLYQNQMLWSGPTNPLETFLEYARQTRLNLDQFAGCLTDEVITKRIIQERKEGEKLQITSTPTFFIGGERIVGPIELQTRGIELIRNLLGEEATVTADATASKD